MDTRPGHQDRAYVSRLQRLRERTQGIKHHGDPKVAAVLAGMLDVLADLVADQEEAERSK